MAEESAIPTPLGAPTWLIARSDARLARAATRGDQRAFAAIYARYHQELYRFCRAIVGDNHEAQDALQNTMASALRSLPGEDRAIELRPWLYRVARNESISIIRRRRALGEAQDAAPAHEPGADMAFESRERMRSLVSDLGKLPERQRSALVMRELSGLGPEQIAAALDVSPGAARQLVYEARLALQQFAEGRSMECERVRKAISDGDGRVLRGRRLRAHLRGCQACSDFKAGIGARGRDFQLIAPPLSAAAASGILASVLGAGVSGGVLSTFAGGLGGGALSAKALGLLAASAAIGVGAGTVSGIEVPGLGPGSDSAPSAAGESARRAPGQSSNPAGAEGGANRPAAGGEGHAHDRSPGDPGSGPAGSSASEHAAEGSAAGGASAATPAGDGQPDSPPGSGVAEARSEGRSATPATGPPERASLEVLPAQPSPRVGSRRPEDPRSIP